MIRLLAVTAAVACLLVSPVYAGQCVQRQRVIRKFVNHHTPVYAQQIVAYDAVYYNVGAGLREEAIAVRAAEIAREEGRKDGQAELLAELKRLGYLNGGATGGPPPDGGAAGNVDAAVQKLLVLRCATCHTGASAKSGLDISNITTLSELQVHKIGTKVQRGSMPQNASGEGVPLPDDEANFIFGWSDDGDVTDADIPASGR